MFNPIHDLIQITSCYFIHSLLFEIQNLKFPKNFLILISSIQKFLHFYLDDELKMRAIQYIVDNGEENETNVMQHLQHSFFMCYMKKIKIHSYMNFYKKNMKKIIERECWGGL